MEYILQISYNSNERKDIENRDLAQNERSLLEEIAKRHNAAMNGSSLTSPMFTFHDMADLRMFRGELIEKTFHGKLHYAEIHPVREQ